MRVITEIVHATKFTLELSGTVESHAKNFLILWNNMRENPNDILKIKNFAECNRVAVTVNSTCNVAFLDWIENYSDTITVLSSESVEFCKIDLESETNEELELFTKYDCDELEFALNAENFS